MSIVHSKLPKRGQSYLNLEKDYSGQGCFDSADRSLGERSATLSMTSAGVVFESKGGLKAAAPV